MTATKAIILAGGRGTRLYPVTRSVSKQLLPVYDKPMIYYPMTTLMLAGLRDIVVIATPEDLPRYRHLLGDGDQWGISLTYLAQHEPRGLADAFIVARAFIGNDAAVLILGDNIFFGADLPGLVRRAIDRNRGATVFACQVQDPSGLGVVKYQGREVVDIVEKPETPPSNHAVTGLYVYDNDVIRVAEGPRALAPGRTRDYRREPPLPAQRQARRTVSGPWHRLARHRHPRHAARGQPVRTHHRTSPRAEDRLPGRGRLAHGVDR